ncbi:hypothetical protein ACFJIV_06675 [Mucilaginibacter sp. UC70_90]
MKKLIFYFVLISAPFCASAQSKKNIAQVSDRKLWLSYMDKVARPVISNLAADQLKEKMPMELSDRVDNKESRAKVGYLGSFWSYIVWYSTVVTIRRW